MFSGILFLKRRHLTEFLLMTEVIVCSILMRVLLKVVCRTVSYIYLDILT